MRSIGTGGGGLRVGAGGPGSVAVVVVASFLLAACAGDPATPSVGEGERASGVPPSCEEVSGPQLVGDGSAGGVDPRAMEDTQTWARDDAADDFGGLWVSDDAAVIAFTDDLDAYADEVRERFGEGWHVVEVERTLAELEQVMERIVEGELGGGVSGSGDPEPGDITSVGLRTSVNRVAVALIEPGAERLAGLGERYGADTICIEVEPVPDESDAELARWAPAPDADLSPDATSIEVLVNEMACAGGTSAEGRIAPPEIVYRDEAVVVTMRVVPRAGPQECPGNPDTPYTLELEEPLGERRLLDGAHEPPVSPDLDRNPPRG